ncbi:MAG: D-alanyl-D-alanine dipeptidase [Comamonadaceae bacterium PBBC2]|nr:MAG: D-alanyl-D-alanine dipeptidase [Comamonadaceae bacterium PBBC2]
MRAELIRQHPDFRALASIPGLAVDLRYASERNFVGRNLYGDADCAWLHREAAAGVQAALTRLAVEHPQLRLVVLDALRPHRVQEALWAHLEGTDLRQYLADPARGSIHSYGMAVDVTLLQDDGTELDMGTGFDELSIVSHPQHEAEHLQQGLLTPTHIANRLALRDAMVASGFQAISTEWWHFDFGDRDRVRREFVRVD